MKTGRLPQKTEKSYAPGEWLAHPPEPYGEAGWQVLEKQADPPEPGQKGGFRTIIGEVNCHRERVYMSPEQATRIALEHNCHDDLVKALMAVHGELMEISRGESCEHSVGVCWCTVWQALEASTAALAKAEEVTRLRRAYDAEVRPRV